MQVAVLGAGAIGGWLAAALADAGIHTSVVARGGSLAAIREGGLRVTRDGVERRYSLRAGSAAELGPQDIVIVATKAQDVARALPELLGLLRSDTRVVSALNGVPWWFTQGFAGPLHNVRLESVDAGGAVAGAIAASRTIGCVVHASATRVAPGCIRVDQVDRLIFGEPRGSVSETVRWLAETFARSGIATLASDNIRLDLWTKLWGNMTLNPISALTRASIGRLLDDPEIRALCLSMMEEMAALSTRIGLPFEISAADRLAVTRRLGDFRTSMLADLDHGLPLEYQPMLGAVVEIARHAGTPAPYCEALLGLTRQLSRSLAAP